MAFWIAPAMPESAPVTLTVNSWRMPFAFQIVRLVEPDFFATTLMAFLSTTMTSAMSGFDTATRLMALVCGR